VEGAVGKLEIQKFAGALPWQRANKKVLITISNLTRKTLEYAGFINTKIILISREELSVLIVDHNVGVSPVNLYKIKKFDSNHFEEEYSF
jgi:restriction system protein